MQHWQNTMCGHAAANIMPVIASNRIGTEQGAGCSLTLYGSSFVTGWHGELIADADKTSEGVFLATIDLDEAQATRTAWGVFRDRRPDLYGALMTLDGDSSR